MFAPTNDAFAKVSNYYDDHDGKYDDGVNHSFVPTDHALAKMPEETVLLISLTFLFTKIPEDALAELLADPEALSVILLR